jgi:hypothetical protein
MAWMYRDVLPASVLCAIVIASCTSTAPPVPEKDAGADCVCTVPGSMECGHWQSGDDMQVCVPMPPPGSGGTSGTGSGGTAGVIPDLGMGGSSGVPSLGGSGGSGAGAGVGSGLTGGVGATAGDGSGAMAGAGNVATGGSGGAPVVTTLGTIVVSAGTKARDHTIVTFPFPAGQGKNVGLKDSQGQSIALQASPADGNFTFILPALAAGQQATYTIEQLAAPAAAGVTYTTEGNQLYVALGTTRVFRWLLTPDNFRNRSANDVRAGYIYPLYTPSGRNVADDYAEDHPHMHGVWSAWTRTTFRNHQVDFWNGFANQGHVDLRSMDGAWSGSVHAGLIANIIHDDITTTPRVTVLNEKWVVTVYKTHDGTAPYFIFDIDSVQTTATPDPLILDQYHYGGFGFRGAQEWATAATFLTSENHSRTSGDGQNARWCAMYGSIGGATGGYAGLGHPSNVRAPQGLRIHPSNPYWAFLPTTALKGGRYTIEPNVPYKSRFRVVTFDGAGNAALLNSLWDDYATPPTVQVMP